MKVFRIILLLLLPGLLAGPTMLSAQSDPLVLQAARVLDGRGNLLTDHEVVIRDGRISAVRPITQQNSGMVYDLGDATLLPGLIDTHVHIGWHFDRTGKTQSDAVEESPEESILYAAENAYQTLMGGVTTVQSLGSPGDAELRDAIARGTLPGPRILTSLRPVTERTGNPDEIRRFVDELAEGGADVIKIFASGSIRDGGAPTLTQEQLDAACGQARERGLRAVVHAHGPESASRAALAECNAIEHGALLDRPTLELMAEHGLYFDPNLDLIFRNYFENKDRFLGVGNYTEEGFAQMRQAIPSVLNAFKEALTVPGLRVVFGTDAVAGAHGRNYEELVYRVREGGQNPMDALVSATSLAAESLKLGDSIGSLAAGMQADIIAVAGDPLEDIGALGRVVFVMKDGKVYKSVPAAQEER